MTRTLLVAFAAAALLLAGCAARDDSLPTPSVDAPQAAPMTNEQALGLLRTAADAMPAAYGFDLRATRGGQELLTAEGTFDNATKETWVSLRGSPAALGGIRAVADGIGIYTSAQGAAYFFPGLAFVQAGSVEELEGVVPAQLFEPDMVLAQVRENVTVQSVSATTYRGESAIEVRFATTGEDAATGRAILFQSPPRVAFLEATLQPEEGGERSAFDGATMAVDVLYGDDAPGIPEKARRALALGYAEARAGKGATWTFARDGAVPLAEIEVHALDAQAEADSPAQKPSLVSMGLDEGSASASGVTLTFDDVDADGLVSQGDKLRIEVADDAERAPQVVLKDTTTGDVVTADMLILMEIVFGF